ncbi:MAG: glucose 1-dehydrogenase [Candidatus Kapaibacterium sp.]
MSNLANLFSLSGKTAVVTGASRGLGAAAAEALAEAGANVVIIGRESTSLNERASELQTLGVKALPIRCDMSRPKQIANAISKGQKEFGTIDILVNNAGIIKRWPATDYPLDDWQNVLNVNLTGAFLMAQGVGRIMIENGGGKIINIASLLSYSGGKFVPAYTASKHGIAGITKALANEWAGKKVNVNAIAPGYFETDATEALRKDRKRFKELSSRIPAGRWGVPDDLKGTVLYLASKASDYVHGQVIVVDGGWMSS